MQWRRNGADPLSPPPRADVRECKCCAAGNGKGASWPCGWFDSIASGRSHLHAEQSNVPNRLHYCDAVRYAQLLRCDHQERMGAEMREGAEDCLWEEGVSFHAPEKFRIRGDPSWGACGAFLIPAIAPRRPVPLKIVASGSLEDWNECGFDLPAFEHVSVSTPTRCPTWEEMCFVKALFWDDEDLVIQYHPRRSQYVNNHPNCLHMWRPIGVQIPEPSTLTVGVQA